MSQSEQAMLRNYRSCFTDDDAEHQGFHYSTCPAHEVPLMKKVAAEFVATFIMIFSAAATPIVDQKYSGVEALPGKAVSAAAPVTVMIISMGHISGAHMNPSVTLALALFKHFPLLNVAPYMVAQVLGSISASFALKAIFSPFHSGGVTVPTVSTSQAFFLEFLITFILLLVVTATTTDSQAVKEVIGITVGTTVLMNVFIAGPSTGGSMNPVRTLGPAVAAGNYSSIWVYMVAPTLGAIAGTGTYTFLKVQGKK